MVCCDNNHYPRTQEHFLAPSAHRHTHLFGGLGLRYNEPLAEGSVPPASAYTIRIDGSPVAIEEGNDGVTVSEILVFIKLAQEASQGQTVTVSYTPPAESPVQDLAGDQAAALDNVEVHNLLDGPTPPPPPTPDTTPPGLNTGLAYGTILRLGYDEDLDESSVPATTAYTVITHHLPNPVVDVDIDGNLVTLTVTKFLARGTVVLWSYVVPEDDPVRDTSGNPAGRGEQPPVDCRRGSCAAAAAAASSSGGQDAAGS